MAWSTLQKILTNCFTGSQNI